MQNRDLLLPSALIGLTLGFASAVNAQSTTAPAAATQSTPASQTVPPAYRRFNGMAPGQRGPSDPAQINRGKALYAVNCVSCHGVDLRGGDLGGPNLLRSQ